MLLSASAPNHCWSPLHYCPCKPGSYLGLKSTVLEASQVTNADQKTDYNSWLWWAVNEGGNVSWIKVQKSSVSRSWRYTEWAMLRVILVQSGTTWIVAPAFHCRWYVSQRSLCPEGTSGTSWRPVLVQGDPECSPLSSFGRSRVYRLSMRRGWAIITKDDSAC